MASLRRRVLSLFTVAAFGCALACSTGPAQAAAAANGTSPVVAGYIASSNTYTSVSASWPQQKVTCPTPTAQASFWVGLDGITSSTIEQIGTQAVCTGGVPAYSAWYQVSPGPPVVIARPLRPGDQVSASVVYTAPSKFTLTITDLTQGWTFTTTQILAGAARSSAEILVQGPATANSLADFGTVDFTNCLINNNSLAAANPVAYNMVTASGILRAQTSALTTPTSFYVTWIHA
jgi:hypothetical protein